MRTNALVSLAAATLLAAVLTGCPPDHVVTPPSKDAGKSDAAEKTDAGPTEDALVGEDAEVVRTLIVAPEEGEGFIDELVTYLQEIHRRPGFDRDTPVVIVAEHDVRWDHVVSCWNAALRADCTRIAFGEP